MIAAAVVEEIIPGAVLLVAKDGKVLHEKAFGYAQRYDYGKVERSEPVSMASNQIFDLASLTKVFSTTFGLMILVDEKKVDLEAPVHTYLPDFRGTNKDSVTVRHLLTHSSGLAPWKPLYYHADTARDTYATIRDLPLASPVGQERHYSDLGFMLLGYLIEAVTGRPLDVFLTEALYEPLGLHATAFQPRSHDLKGFAVTSHGNPFEKRMVADDDFGYLCDEDPQTEDVGRGKIACSRIGDVR